MSTTAQLTFRSQQIHNCSKDTPITTHHPKSKYQSITKGDLVRRILLALFSTDIKVDISVFRLRITYMRASHGDIKIAIMHTSKSTNSEGRYISTVTI